MWRAGLAHGRTKMPEIDEALSSAAPPAERLPPERVRQYEFCLTHSAGADDPFDVIIPRMHEGPEVFWSPEGLRPEEGAWIFRRDEDVRKVFLDNEHFSTTAISGVLKLIGSDASLIPNEIDPPDHTWYRALLNPAFSPNRMASLEGMVEQEVDRLIERFRADGGCDFVTDFAIPLPVAIFLRLLGLPIEEMDSYVQWEKIMIASLDHELRRNTLLMIEQCLKDAMAERAVNPRDDVLSHLVHAEFRGRRLTPEECINCALVLYLAGLDTVTSTLGWQIKYLAEHTEDQQRLRDDPALLVGGAMEELQRAFATVTVPRRCVKRYVTREGVTIEPGEKVLMSTSAAGRDPEAYDNPNQIILDRNPTAVTFAYGVHRCLGSHLARRELRISIQKVLEKLPAFTRTNSHRLPMRFGNVLALEELPLQW
jgi:cytochrome P450